MKWLCFCLKFCLLFSGLVVLQQQARAEFLKTSPLVYQSTNRKAQIIVNQLVSGIFIAYGKEIDLQEFDPSNLKASSSMAIFIHFDQHSKKYSLAQVGERKYQIRGSALLQLGALRISIDNSSPHLVVIDETDSSKPALIAFHEINEAINTSGEMAVALLEANQLNEYRQLIKSLEIRPLGLFIEGAFYQGSYIGIDLDVQNPCTDPKAIWLNTEDVSLASSQVDGENKKKKLREALGKAVNRSSLNDKLYLSVNKQVIFMLDYSSPSIVTVKQSLDLSSKQAIICLIEPIGK